ncbi:MAG: hypothetical protein F6J95_024735 [Leptolyngbya sp. SIO1E4]|nr:hypothetical protein [Leptolyngbya sp. SIO1E4]
MSVGRYTETPGQQTFGHIWSVDRNLHQDSGPVVLPLRGIDEYGNLLDVRLSEHRDILRYAG